MKGIISDSNRANFQENFILPPQSLKGRLLYHPVWNGENYIIFNIWNAGSAEQFCANNPPPHKNIERALMPTFKFMWQFFRGLKTIICIGDHCFGYDPFAGTITSFSAKNESFFDYSMSDIRGKQISNLVYDSRDPCDYYFGLKHWDEFQHFLMETVVEHMNGALYLECCRVEGDRDECHLDFSGRIEKDIDVVTFEVRLEDDDFRHLDVVSMYDFGKLCFIVPDKGYMPSYLIPARCFSAIVWLWTILSVATFVTVHEGYRRFYLMTGVDPTVESVSTFFIVYRFILCAAHPRLLLGHPTGRILFVVFSFSCLVLTTAFLSTMVTFQSIRLVLPC